uniref:RING-type E3 ubiquitin transferase n=1 Tax=Noccaea caerulescens TaxID=107243 RepID=A0A1J3JZT8_NOCCA
MAIFTRDLINQIVTCALLPLFFFQFLPYVTCQEKSESADPKMIVGTILIGMFLSTMIFFCLFYVIYRSVIAAEGRDVLQARSGLDKDIIESFPIFLYSEVKGLKVGNGGVECAICLNEFEDEEKLRWMPTCSHTFHASCIDVWLSSRSTCPVCRANLSLKPEPEPEPEPGESFIYPITDLETGNAQSGIQESPDISLNGNSVIPRSRSVGLLSSWRMSKIFVPKSHSTGHSSVQLGENLERFTLQLPEEVQRQLVSLNLISRDHMALPRARSSRQGYRSGSVGNERMVSMSLSFSFEDASVRSTLGSDVRQISQAKDKDYGEGSFSRLMPD